MGVHDFDFLPGRWTVENRRLVEGEWITFPASSHAFDARRRRQPRPLPRDGYEGFALRLYDAEADVWRIWWSSTARPGRLDLPVKGRFAANGTATFEADDVLDGVPLRMRFVWSEITADAARWEQSFSFDEGETWVPDWTMLLTRAE